MAELVTLQDAYDHLRIDYGTDGSAEDGWLGIFIPAISEAVILWLKDAWRPYVIELDTDGEPVLDTNGDPVPELNTNGDPTPKPVVRAAVLVELASQFRYREGEGKDNIVTPDAGHGYVLNKASTALLSALRKSTVA